LRATAAAGAATGADIILRGGAFAASALARAPRISYAAPQFLQATSMGHRLSKIVTKTGDGGTTGLGDGSRVSKESTRIAAIGDVDELNSVVGVLLADALPTAIRTCLTSVQHDLFDLGGELSIPGYTAVTEAHVERLEADVERFNADLAPLKEFILPGGTRAAAIAHVGRTVCRRAERALVRLAAEAPVSGETRRYLNRLSDLLFVLARRLNKEAGTGDVLWQKERAARAK
jgi:cob(I)alamin adenosyltransferase